MEIVKRGLTPWYRIVHDDNLLDWLSIAAAQRLLSDAGVDMGDLVEAAPTGSLARPQASTPRRRDRHGSERDRRFQL
jgi:bifunctional non-homologous end joining protein LigD